MIERVKISAKDREDFIEAVTALSKKAGIAFKTCGCCNSPWLYRLTAKEPQEGEHKTQFDYECLQWDAEET